MGTAGDATSREPWNERKIVGQKVPFKLEVIWALRIRVQTEGRMRELALFNLGIDSKLQGCVLMDLVFVGGVMKLAWIVALAVAVSFEEPLPRGERIAAVLVLSSILFDSLKLFGRLSA